MLGTLLFLQLALTASVGAASALSRMLDSDPQQHGAADLELHQSGHAKLLQVRCLLGVDTRMHQYMYRT